MITLLIVGIIALILLGLPVATALGLGSAIFIFFNGTPDLLIASKMVSGLDSFPLLAIPFFIFAGNLMNRSQITDRIFAFASSLIGWIPGGLGYVNVSASVVFAGMSGAAVADAGGLGSVEIKAMKEKGYNHGFAAGITAASSTIGPLIPPSLPLIIFGFVGGVSIGELFIAGIVPGLLMAAFLMIMVWHYVRKNNMSADDELKLDIISSTFKASWMALLTPFLIVGGIVSGIVTPTEAAIAASAYTLFLGLVVYRTLNWENIKAVTIESVEMSASILFIISTSTIFAWILTSNQVAVSLANSMTMISDNPIVLLLMINLILLVIGCFLDSIAAITILTPILMPIAISIGIDPVQFGIIVVLNLMIGLLTPPMGMVLFVISTAGKVPIQETIRGTIPFLIPLILSLMAVTFIPALSMWLPSVLGY